jgi:hypothetical protein
MLAMFIKKEEERLLKCMRAYDSLDRLNMLGMEAKHAWQRWWYFAQQTQMHFWFDACKWRG